MPRKIRELKAQIVHEGFVYLSKRGKGSMSVGDILSQKNTDNFGQGWRQCASVT
ncbi:hypothetical protein [Nostoc sp.]|uniref:hypothetical protein n=1 Tax=Nostoc sp. TaxID=1180 RepID=UPI002FF61BC8